MAARRSARLQAVPTADSSPPSPQAPQHHAESTRKRNTPPAKAQTAAIRPTKRATPSAVANHERNGCAPSAPADCLSRMPLEVLNQILDKMQDMSDLGKLGRTNKRYYSIVAPKLFKRTAVAAMFHAHIPKVIRALEPHLTIAQKKQLKKEGQYKGQQERYASHLDEHATPACASYVTQILVGVCNPGRKHEDIVRRYVEEAFKNMINLEIIETYMLTESIAKNIAGMKNLKALSLDGSFPADTMSHLATIRDMQHLAVKGCEMGGGVVASILANSASTLRSLEISANSFHLDFLRGWESIMPKGDKHDLSALESFSMTGLSFGPKFLKRLDQAIDLMRLTELDIGRLRSNRRVLFDHLTNLSAAYQTADTPLGLRKLKLEMWDGGMRVDHDDTAAKIRFISSFSTLTSLTLVGYNQYSTEITTNPGLSESMMQAVLKHKNLKTLRISYIGIINQLKIPYLSAATVKTIIDSLHQLENFEFAPEESEINDIGEALSGGANLRSITCFPHESWASYPRPDRPGFNIITAVVQGFLSQISRIQREREGRADAGLEALSWENCTKLQSVSVQYATWEIASKFGKTKKGMKAPERIIGAGTEQALTVLCRDITGTFPKYIHVGYDPTFEWMERVSKKCT